MVKGRLRLEWGSAVLDLELVDVRRRENHTRTVDFVHHDGSRGFIRFPEGWEMVVETIGAGVADPVPEKGCTPAESLGLAFGLKTAQDDQSSE